MDTLTCPICGREFQAKGYGDVKRKYCSRACANRGRAAERRDANVPEQDNEKA
jgi:MYM-type Zinc finger with FCS sequence motif.